MFLLFKATVFAYKSAEAANSASQISVFFRTAGWIVLKEEHTNKTI